MYSLVPFNPTHHYQASGMNTPVPPGFGQQQSVNYYSQFPRYQMSPCFPGQVATAISTPGFQMQQGLGYYVVPNVIEPFNNQGFIMTSAYNSMAYDQPQVRNNPVNHLDAQGPSQQIQVERDGNLVEELEQSNLPMTTRIRWTPELQRRFDDAVRELGGYFAHQDNTTIQAQQVSEGVEAYTSFRPNFQSPINVEEDRLPRTIEAPNDNESVALVEDPATNFSFKDYDWAPNHNQDYFEDIDFPAMMSSPYGYQNVGSASRSDYAPFSDFKDSDFSFPEPHD
ncbi:hypothetical protein ACET3Z_026234 [Daucus carota]